MSEKKWIMMRVNRQDYKLMMTKCKESYLNRFPESRKHNFTAHFMFRNLLDHWEGKI